MMQERGWGPGMMQEGMGTRNDAREGMGTRNDAREERGRDQNEVREGVGEEWGWEMVGESETLPISQQEVHYV